MRIYYLYNSGFLMDLGDIALVFDYYRTDAQGGKGLLGGQVPLEFLQQKAKVHVFASHAHPDHYNGCVLEWKNIGVPVEYYLSDDIPIGHKGSNMHLFSPLSEHQAEDIRVRAYASTDEGVSFFVETAGMKIFHAGDLNDWTWRNEADETYIAQAHKAFMDAMQPIERDVQRPDVAFFPVDPRMEIDYDAGALYFAQAIRPKLFIPMHFRRSVQAPMEFAQKLHLPDVSVWTFDHRGAYIDVQA